MTSANARIENPTQGTFLIELENDNIRHGIEVNLRFVAIQIEKKWRNEPYWDTQITPRKEKQTFREPIITTTERPFLE